MGTRLFLTTAFVILALAGMAVPNAPVCAAGGPVILMGIDAEDGGPGGHGPVAVYAAVVNNILSGVTNGGSGVLVLGGGKSPDDDVTQFWNAVGLAAGKSVTFVPGITPITSQSFPGFALIVVTSDRENTPSGGLTAFENWAVTQRKADIAAFVNGGGGLLGFVNDFPQPYAYLGDVGSFDVQTLLEYNDITPTAFGLGLGITNALDVSFWHDEYLRFPSFLSVLATNADTGHASAIGGSEVSILSLPPVQGPIPDKMPPSVSCTLGTTMLWPPNHDLVNVGLTVRAADDTDPNPTVAIQIFANEDDETPTGDGRFSPDAKPGASFRPAQLPLRLRAERKGDGGGRVYLILVSATDADGNVAFHACTVVVPHSQSAADKAAVLKQAADAEAYGSQYGAAPPGFVPVGDGPVIGPKQ
jgi:hypothetical protein